MRHGAPEGSVVVCRFVIFLSKELKNHTQIIKLQEVLFKSQEKVQVRSAARAGTGRLERGLKKPCHCLAFTSEGLEKGKLSALGDDTSVRLCFA